ncbi:MAG: DUF5312 domain-containing protein [Treponema sp.]|jgi:truncated hemoglobin YjbI|nr:DUF5312 domain-containing protein [Treponema sp.]
MSNTGVFGHLASTLSMDDRRNLLEKLNAQAGGPQVLYDDERALEAETGDGKKNYETQPWFYRFFYWFIGLCKGKTALQVFQDRQLSQLGRLIEAQWPGMYNYEQDLLLPAFYDAVAELKESARFFYDALDMSVNRDRGAFYAFLASLEMEDIHRMLVKVTDPQKISEQHRGASEAALKQLGFQAMDEGIAAIGDDKRAAMYYNARTLNCLKELASFLFDRLLVSFSTQNARKGNVCSAHLVNNYLRSLNDILYSLKETPSMTLLESLFIFILQDQAEAPEFNMENEMEALLSRAQKALEVIRSFNKTAPLNWILRCAEKDMNIVPKMISGGEDWFSMYKDYWRRTVEVQFNDYIRHHHRRELMAEFEDFFGGAGLKPLAGAESEDNPAGIPFKGAFCLAFLRTFHTALFLPQLNLVLRPILIDGDFLRKENFTEFSDSYEALFKADVAIRIFENDISEAGDLGKQYAAAKLDMSSLSVKRHKIQLVENEAADEAKKIIDRIRDAVTLMAKVLSGIAAKSPGGKYGALANQADMSGKTNAFVAGVNRTIKTLTKTLELMDKINFMEAGR